MTENFEQFFLNYKSFYNQIIQDDLINYSTILNEVGIISENGLKEEEVLTSNYNIFNILKVEKNENGTHTPFLLDLFNIKGSHRQKELFYNNLIEQIITDKVERKKFLSNDPSYFNITSQRGIYHDSYGQGFLDIFIDYNEPGNKSFSIVIENKIYHYDEDDQLNKYYSFLKSLNRDNILLIYLTPKGKYPEPNSMKLNMVNKLVKSGELKLISYHKDVKSLLTESLPKIKSEKVKYTVLQYLTLINTL
jgi:hypothetical protein